MINGIIHAFEQRLQQLLPRQGTLYEAARYSLFAPAKRLRPLLLLAGCSAYHIDLQRSLDAACALECIHTYSLIHDDLPAMDDDDMRRGQPTLHKVYGEAAAILAGDFLLTYAFEILANTPFLTPYERIALIQIMTHAAGGEGMVGGQLLDIQNDPNTTLMHTKKTAALFCAAMQCVAILSSTQDSPLLAAFGTAFGQLFQLIDDLDDDDHPEGKTIAHQKASALHLHCHHLLSQLSVPVPLLTEIMSSLIPSTICCEMDAKSDVSYGGVNKATKPLRQRKADQSIQSIGNGHRKNICENPTPTQCNGNGQ